MHAFNFDKLVELDRMAAWIKQPKIYGVFEDDKHYLSTLDLLLMNSETENRNNFFIQQVLPYVATNAMIDVGIGDGKLTGLIGDNFREITLVDTSSHALDSVEHYVDNRKLTKMLGSILDVDLQDNQFDLAVLSHTLYYIDITSWIDVTVKLLSSLKENGMLVIVLNGGLDKDSIADMFGGQRLAIDTFIDNCHQLNVNSIEVSHTIECFNTKSLSTMLHIVGLHLYDVGATATSSQLTDYLTARRDKSTQLYQFSVCQKFILLRKQI